MTATEMTPVDPTLRFQTPEPLPVNAADATATHTGGRSALAIAIASAAAFGSSGTCAKALLDAGWSPAAAVTARIALAALVLAIPTVLALRGRWHLLRSRVLPIAIYGLTGVAGCQLAYFNAVNHLSVGVALMLEYLSPVLLVLGVWAWKRRRPATLTLVGTTTCVVGLVLVLDVFGGAHLSAVGIAWGLGAAVCSAGYFVLAGRSDDEFPPLALAGVGMAVGAVLLGVLGALGILPMHATTRDTIFAGHHTSFLVPLVALAVIATAFAYATGVMSARRLGTTVASFVALAEVLFSVVFAWLLLGQLPLPVQLAGGVLIVGGVVLVRLGELRGASRHTAR
ncbi:EamA family transporter [Rudaeicoccus suwonensis]|uniref:Threonine/homoserine efflux transporter RhtA n=1 Tax=Rudaeicoccus suwonensis TaxID=657409 RepID=A0A561E2W0_9MICO|nr:DMT family transporter [Rudaeicoccus suwonensis]TWE09942.1 threonine/homoserine efflux transporter RhtA [Rudaeicoccus suwonensis]